MKDPFTKLKEEEGRFDDMIKSYFQLFDEPNKFHEVMDDLNLKVNDTKDTEDTVMSY